MQQRRKALALILCGVAAWFAWTALARSASEVATLHISDVRNKDHFARLWVVEARPYLWIRAERPDRSWLQPLRESPRVRMRRRGERARYTATVWERDDVREQVDALFREKYGLADLARAWLFARDTIPIRLEPL